MYWSGSPAARSLELASSPSAPHPLACRAVAWAAVRLSGLATQDRWRGIISASQSAMAAVVGVGRLSHPPDVCTCTHIHTNACMYTQLPSAAPAPAQPPAIYEAGRRDRILRSGENCGIWQSCPCPTLLLDHRLNQLGLREGLPRPILDSAPASKVSLQLPPLGMVCSGEHGLKSLRLRVV